MTRSQRPFPAEGDTPGLVWLKPGDRSAPLFVFAGAGGDVNELAPLAERLTDARAAACLDLTAIGPWTSVEEIVERALELMAEIQPSGPYHLLGYSFGGLIALEVARRLREAGNQVAPLLLVVAFYDRAFWPLSVWVSSQARLTLGHLRDLRGAPPGRAVAEVRRRAGRLIGRAAARLAGARAPEIDAEVEQDEVEVACKAAMARFRPRPYSGPAIFFQAKGDETLGCYLPVLWRHLVGHLEVEEIPSDHLGIVRTPNALARLAKALDLRLAAAKPLVLLVAARGWHASGRLALELSKAGFAVRGLCPAGHVLEQVEFVDATRRLAPFRRLRSLRCELTTASPDLVVPADDVAARLLHSLHAQACRQGSSGEPLRRLLERSLGGAGGYDHLYARAGIAAVAETAAIVGPRTLAIKTRAMLWDAIADFGLPAVLKTDGSSGGEGVAIVHTRAEAERSWRRLAAPPSLLWSLKRLIVDREFDRLGAYGRRRRVVNLQAFVPGRPANAAAALWRGEVLACVCCEVVETMYPTGPATVVRIVQNPQMHEAVARMARTLGLSGFCGVDFILDEAGQAHLIEVNPRATPTAHLRDADGRSPPEALCAAVLGRPIPVGDNGVGECVALFPMELIRDPKSEHLATARHDVPVQSRMLVHLGRGLAWRRNARPKLLSLLKRGP
jgi:thioesterase domain-containing protein